jgi:hypothetical protein
MKRLEDYTQEEIERLDEIQRLMEEYNARVARDHAEIYNKPNITQEEVAANSRYREMLIEKQCKEEDTI